MRNDYRVHFSSLWVFGLLAMQLTGCSTPETPSTAGSTMQLVGVRDDVGPLIASYRIQGEDPSVEASTACEKGEDKVTCSFSSSPIAAAEELKLIIGSNACGTDNLNADTCPWPLVYTNPQPLVGHGGAIPLSWSSDANLSPSGSGFQVKWEGSEKGIQYARVLFTAEGKEGKEIHFVGDFRPSEHAPDGELAPVSDSDCKLFTEQQGCWLPAVSPNGWALNIQIYVWEKGEWTLVKEQESWDGDPIFVPCPDADGDSHFLAECATGEGDCDDTDDSIYPTATETPYDGIDQDCDGKDPTDVDEDSFDSVAVSGGTDCNDSNASVYPGAPERCNDVDDDCDGFIDEDAMALTPSYPDTDDDGFGDSANPNPQCIVPEGNILISGDCNDNDNSVYPTVPEIPYDGIDQDCKEGDLVDVDIDGFNGGPSGTDCDDSDTSIYPTAIEIPYDGIDQDCDELDITDVDGDGYESPIVGGDDCDDTNINTYPGASEFEDYEDNDCDGEVDEDLDSNDDDGDGFSEQEGDCNDNDASINPAATETPYDGTDQDCSGKDLTDVDGDGYDSTVVSGTDCNDNDSSIYPAATEIPYDAIDQDCSGKDVTDVDKDGFDSVAVSGGTDCNDTDNSVHPGVLELNCDDVDNDCDVSTVGQPAPAQEMPGDNIDQDCDGLDECHDLTCDGMPDIFVGYSDAAGSGVYAGVYVARSSGNGQYSYHENDFKELNVGGIPIDTAIADLNSDGYLDAISVGLVGPDNNPPAALYVWKGQSVALAPVGVGLRTPANRITIGGVVSGIQGITIANLNSDSYPDIIVSAGGGCGDPDYSAQSSYILYGSANLVEGTTTLAQVKELAVPCAYHSAVGDLDGDGDLDLVLAARKASISDFNGVSYVYYNQGSTVPFDDQYRVGITLHRAFDVAIGDVNGDSYNDVVFAGAESSNTETYFSYVFWGEKTGESIALNTALVNATKLDSSGDSNVVVSDLNDDGFDDIVFGMYFNDDDPAPLVSAHIWWGSNDFRASSNHASTSIIGALTGNSGVYYGKQVRDLDVGDLDGDDCKDVIVGNNATTDSTNNRPLYLFHGQCGSNFSWTYSSTPSTLPFIARGIAIHPQGTP